MRVSCELVIFRCAREAYKMAALDHPFQASASKIILGSAENWLSLRLVFMWPSGYSGPAQPADIKLCLACVSRGFPDDGTGFNRIEDPGSASDSFGVRRFYRFGKDYSLIFSSILARLSLLQGCLDPLAIFKFL